MLEIIKSKAEHWKIQFNYVKKGRETEAAGGADALAEGHRLVPQNLTHLSEQDTQRNYFLQRLVNFLLILERMLRTKLRKNVLDILVCDVSISMPTLKYTENNKKSNSFKNINDLFI